MNTEDSQYAFEKASEKKDAEHTDTDKNQDDASENLQAPDAENDEFPDNINAPVRDMVILHTIILLIVSAITLTGLIIAAINVYSSVKGDRLFNDYFSNQPIVYAKEDGIYFHNLGNSQSYELSEAACDKSLFSADGKRIFILSGKELLYLNCNKIDYDNFNSSVIKIDTGIDDFECSTSGRFAVYLKQSSLYACSPGNTPFLICENVLPDFSVNDSDNSVIYKTSSGDLGIYDITSQKNVLIKNISDYELSNGKTQKIYYISNNRLFLYEKNKENKLIHENINDIFSCGSSIFALIYRSEYMSLYAVSPAGIQLIEKKIDGAPEIYKNFFIYKRITGFEKETRVITKNSINFNLFDTGSAAKNINITDDGQFLYALMQYRKSLCSLMKFKIDKNGISERIILSDNCSDYTLFENGSIIFKNSYGTQLCSNNKTTLITPYSLYDMSCHGNTIYAIEGTPDDYFKLLRIKNGSVQLLDENVSGDYIALSSSEALYIKNDALYSRYGNQESILIDNNVKSIIKNEKND